MRGRGARCARHSVYYQVLDQIPLVGPCSAWLGLARFGLACLCLAWLDLAWLGAIVLGLAGRAVFGLARLGLSGLHPARVQRTVRECRQW